ncbi:MULTISPECIES: peptide ABC transporter substrate-binding protein [unclassified Streptomyces]|uniref:peptide ABC transporter substrate-binding protein n=1 Tax=unclassified Streptomyces TaxID=2593676 RepID=UPI0010104013|nr:MULTISPECIES: ABC transporter substrate-binding protein [unclassified Streptomyces]NJA55507.1 ABC transporter substrate-binding protein [Streptomyces sp. NEAU-H3]
MRVARTAVAAVAVVAVSTALTSCGSLDGTSGSDLRSGALTAVQMATIARITGPQNPGSQIGMALCEGLTRIDDAGKVHMDGAESVTSSDRVTWTIKVAPGRTFSDGTPVTAKTWVDSFNFTALGSHAMASNFAYAHVAGYPALNPAKGKAKRTTLSGLKVTGKDTFTLTMDAPNNDLPYMLATLPFCPMPESAFKNPIAYDKKPVTNGPYVLTKLKPQFEAVVERRKDYKGWIPEGAADKITFRVYNDANTAYQDVVAGNTAVLRSLPPGLIAQGKNALGAEALTAVPRNTLETYITWPTYLDKKYPKEVRKAFSMIIDRDAISKNLFLGSSQAAHSLMPNSVSAYSPDPCGTTCSFDPAAARKLLDRSGFKGTIPLLYDSTDTTFAEAALAISNEAKRIGLKVEPQPRPTAALGADTNNYALDGPSLALWGSSFPSASEWVASIMVDANYRLKYTNPTASSEVAKAWAARSPAEADRHWRAAESSILSDQVIQPLYYQVMYIAHDPCLKPHSAGGDMQIYRTQITCGTGH